MTFRRGLRLKTSYNTGHPYYVVQSVFGPCNCGRYVDVINRKPGDPEPVSQTHFHLVVREPGDNTDSFLGGYTADGKSVWSDDYLVEMGQETVEPIQQDLFA